MMHGNTKLKKKKIRKHFDGFVLDVLIANCFSVSDARTDGLDQFLLFILTGLQNRVKTRLYRYGRASKPVEASV